jgi:hypothetical protein
LHQLKSKVSRNPKLCKGHNTYRSLQVVNQVIHITLLFSWCKLVRSMSLWRVLKLARYIFSQDLDIWHRSLQVVNQVIHILNTDTQPDQVFRESAIRPRLGRSMSLWRVLKLARYIFSQDLDIWRWGGFQNKNKSELQYPP